MFEIEGVSGTELDQIEVRGFKSNRVGIPKNNYRKTENNDL